jgi:hypothetical protein
MGATGPFDVPPIAPIANATVDRPNNDIANEANANSIVRYRLLVLLVVLAAGLVACLDFGCTI